MIKRDQNKNDISERNLSLQDKILFHQAKVRELKSFFENGVWSFQTQLSLIGRSPAVFC